jgi:hypothetical protein
MTGRKPLEEQTMSDSPTFVATFDDGEVTRMTVHQCCVNELDVGRGVRLAHHAYNSRKRNSRKRTQTPPPIKEARYENGEGVVLRTYTPPKSLRRSKSAGGARSGQWQKKPIIKGWQETATTDHEQIRKWWRRHPYAVQGETQHGI